MWFFAGFTLLAYGGLLVYVGARLFGLVRFLIPCLKAPVFWFPFLLLGCALVFFNFVRDNRLAVFQHIASYWLGIFVYLVLSFLLFDVVRLVLRLFAKDILTPRFFAIGAAAALCLAIIISVYGVVHARSIRTINYNLNLAGQGDDVRIVLVSDIHIGPTVDTIWLARIVDAINRAEPDVVCIAGDVFDGNLDIVKDVSGIAAEFRRIGANVPLGVYACLGNHDVDRARMSEGGTTARIETILREGNIVPLMDEVLPLGENLYIAGRRDARPIGMNAARKTAEELLAGLDKNRALVVMDHQPTQFAQLEEAGADLVLCGHTHKGQFFPWNLVTRVMYKKQGATHYGYWNGNTMQALVTSGAGLWGPPLRVATNSEVVVIDVRFTVNRNRE